MVEMVPHLWLLLWFLKQSVGAWFISASAEEKEMKTHKLS